MHFFGSCYDDPYNYVVDSIDTVSILGVERKRMQLKNIRNESLGHWSDVTWIEGIGSYRGILYSAEAGTGEDGHYLACVTQGDSLIYQDEYFSSCYYSTVDVQEAVSENAPIEIYPNPAVKGQPVHIKLNLQLDSPRIVIYNASGQQVDAFEPESENVSFETYSSGLLLIKVMDGDRLVDSRKLIVR
jgi:hypothetical protein